MKTLLAVLLLIICPGLTAGTAQAAGRPITVIAHRCNGGTMTQDTLAACVQATATGASWLEMDVRWTKPTKRNPYGVPVILHDPDLGVFGAPKVDIADVSVRQAAAYVSRQHNTVTLLSQMRDVVIISRAKLDLELKTRPTAAQWRVLDARLAPIKGVTTIFSFDRATLADATVRGYDTAFNTYADVGIPPPGVSLVLQRAPSIDRAHVAALRGLQVETWCFSCNTPASWTAMKAAGVTGFVTDHHAAAQAWVDGHR